MNNIKEERFWTKAILLPLNERFFFVTFCFTVSVIITDFSLARINRFILLDSSSQFGLFFFLFTILVFLFSQRIIILFVESKISKVAVSSFPYFRRAFKAVSVAQYASGVLLILIFCQMFFISSYNLFFLKGIIWLSYIQAIFITGLLSFKFVSWFRINKDITIIAYCAALIIFTLNCISTLWLVSEYLSFYPTDMQHHGSGFMPYVREGDTLLFKTTSVGSYFAAWTATSLLMLNYFKKLGTIRYCIIVCLPMFYYAIQFIPPVLEALTLYRSYDPLGFSITYTLFFSNSQSIGAILFGIAFWSIGKKAGITKIRDFMNIVACGLVLFFSSNQAVVLSNAPYPLFGAASISFLGIASYMILIGIYFSAISLSQDVTLRKAIRSSLMDHSSLLDKIGLSEMTQTLQSRSLDISRRLSKTMSIRSGISPSMEEQEIKNYINDVINEIQSKPAANSNSSEQ